MHVVRLRAGDRDQARTLFAIMAEVFEEDRVTPSDAFVDRLLDRPDFWALAAIADGEIVGGLTAWTLPLTRSESSEIFLYDLAVLADHQRTGIGTQLVRTLREQAAAQGIFTVFVPADNEDTHALEFYRRLGGTAAAVTIFTFEPDQSS